MPVRIILIGAPGAGKGTQADGLKKLYGIKHFSTGELLRKEVATGSDLGKRCDGIMRRGSLVCDDIMLALVKNELVSLGPERGWILDGFPRTLSQANALNKLLSELSLSLTGVMHLHVPDDILFKRLLGRWVQPGSGRTYNVNFAATAPNKVDHDSEGIVTAAFDDETGESLTQRSDDKEEFIKKRLEVYHQYADSIINFYKEQELLCTVESSNKEEALKSFISILGKPSTK